MQKIELNKIRGEWREQTKEGFVSGGNDTIDSIRLVAEKVNEIIESLEIRL